MRYLRRYNESKVFDPNEMAEAIKIELEDCKLFHADVEKSDRFGASNRVCVDVIADFSDNEEVIQMFNNICDEVRKEMVATDWEEPKKCSNVRVYECFSGARKGILFSKLINVIKPVMDKIVRKWDLEKCTIKPMDIILEYLPEYDNEQMVALSCKDNELKFGVRAIFDL